MAMPHPDPTIPPPLPPKKLSRKISTIMSHNFESDVINALEELLKTESNYDVIIYVGEKPDIKEFHAHSGFLCCRSDYFSKILTSKNVEKSDGKYVIKEPTITPQAFDVVIK